MKFALEAVEDVFKGKTGFTGWAHAVKLLPKLNVELGGNAIRECSAGSLLTADKRVLSRMLLLLLLLLLEEEGVLLLRLLLLMLFSPRSDLSILF